MKRAVRVRFAPSPTGPLHIGGVRTALFNFLFAKKYQGKFILRIEDTDSSRLIKESEDYIRKALIWCGIIPDESPWHGGKHAPYRQSERKELYSRYVDQLIEQNYAYYAFDTPEELKQMHNRLEKAHVASPQYNTITRSIMKNSLTLSERETSYRIEKGEPYVIRLKMPHKEEIRFRDGIRGWIVVHSFTLDDKILIKSNGMPTYHLANVIDDYLMDITHVIRGEEWLPSAPLHILLYRYLGWEEKIPKFAHLPLLLKPDGNGKLSKRDSSESDLLMFPLKWKNAETKKGYKGYKEEGYFPEAFMNFLALLGWNPGIKQEIFSMNELIEKFSINRIGKSGIKFSIEKARWFNEQYLKSKLSEDLAILLLKELEKDNIKCSFEKAKQICSFMKGRIAFLKDLYVENKFFFVAPDTYDDEIIQREWNWKIKVALKKYISLLLLEENLTSTAAKTILKRVLEKEEIKRGILMQILRVLITGKASGPDLMQVIAILGSNETTKRIDNALKKLTYTYLSK